MDEYSSLVVLPIVIAVGNVILMLLLTTRRRSLVWKVGWSSAVILATPVVWFFAAMPYIMGLTDSYASCSGQPGYPGCQQFEQISALFGQTLGNFGLLLLVLILDLII